MVIAGFASQVDSGTNAVVLIEEDKVREHRKHQGE